MNKQLKEAQELEYKFHQVNWLNSECSKRIAIKYKEQAKANMEKLGCEEYLGRFTEESDEWCEDVEYWCGDNGHFCSDCQEAKEIYEEILK